MGGGDGEWGEARRGGENRHNQKIWALDIFFLVLLYFTSPELDAKLAHMFSEMNRTREHSRMKMTPSKGTRDDQHCLRLLSHRCPLRETSRAPRLTYRVLEASRRCTTSVLFLFRDIPSCLCWALRKFHSRRVVAKTFQELLSICPYSLISRRKPEIKYLQAVIFFLFFSLSLSLLLGRTGLIFNVRLSLHAQFFN